MSAFRLGEKPQGERERPAADEKSRQREGEPSADIQSPQRIFRALSGYAGPSAIFKQSIVGRSVESEFTKVG